MQFARGCEFTTKNKNSVRKKIVRDPSVFVGPLPSALPPPLKQNAIRVYPRVIVGCCSGHVASRHSLWVIVSHGFSSRITYAWVIVGHGFLVRAQHYIVSFV